MPDAASDDAVSKDSGAPKWNFRIPKKTAVKVEVTDPQPSSSCGPGGKRRRGRPSRDRAVAIEVKLEPLEELDEVNPGDSPQERVSNRTRSSKKREESASKGVPPAQEQTDEELKNAAFEEVLNNSLPYFSSYPEPSTFIRRRTQLNGIIKGGPLLQPDVDKAVEGLLKHSTEAPPLPPPQRPSSPPPPPPQTFKVEESAEEALQKPVPLPGTSAFLVPVTSKKCYICEAAFDDAADVRKHMKLVHSGIKSEKGKNDPKAPKPLVRKDAPTRRKRRAPTTVRNVGDHVCGICHKRFRQLGHLTNHLRLHTGERPFECDICGKRFSQSGHLVSHIRSHTNTRPYACQYCRKRFTQSGHLNNHERLHLGERPYTCTHCGKSFTQSGHLVNHIRLHDGEKPFQCSVCNKKFTQSGHLSNHLKLHKGGKPHQCEFCNKKFTQAGHLTDHIRIHTNEKPFECSICCKAFAQNSHLTAHMRTHRNINLEAAMLTGAGGANGTRPLIIKVRRDEGTDNGVELGDSLYGGGAEEVLDEVDIDEDTEGVVVQAAHHQDDSPGGALEVNSSKFEIGDGSEDVEYVSSVMHSQEVATLDINKPETPVSAERSDYILYKL